MDFKNVNIKALTAELVGTFTLTAAVLASLTGTVAIPTPLIAGIVLSLFVLSVGNVSGTHINPAVTIGLWSVKKIDAANAVGYILAQFAGALLAAIAIENLVGADVFANTIVGLDWFGDFDGKVVLAEAFGMGIFTFGIAGAIHSKVDDMAGAWLIGMSLFVGILVAATVSNGVLNPAVAAGIESLDWSYLVGPILGSVVGLNAYQYFITEKGQL